MRIVVCVKEVLDPAAVNNFALAGGLKIGADGKTPEVAAIPRLINGYDEQAIEAALRLRDAGIDCRISVVTIGADAQAMLKQCAALGADEIAAIDPGARELDCAGVASVLHAYITGSGCADLVLCGRQASDDDQGVVPLLLAEKLGIAHATIIMEVKVEGGAKSWIKRSSRRTRRSFTAAMARALRSRSPAPEITAHDCAIESILHSSLAAEPSAPRCRRW